MKKQWWVMAVSVSMIFLLGYGIGIGSGDPSKAVEPSQTRTMTTEKSMINERLLTNVTVTYGQRSFVLKRALSRQVIADTTLYRFQPSQLPDLTVAFKTIPVSTAGYEGELLYATITSNQPLRKDLTIKVPLAWPESATVSLPRKNGLLAAMAITDTATYRFAGMDRALGQLLSLPMIWTTHQDGQLQTLFTDPYYSATFTPSGIEWTYPAAVGLEHDAESRVIGRVFLSGNADDALRCFFNLALPDVPPGPSWLHEIAMVNYDYLSDGGQGWFRDIDALVPVVAEPDRRQVVLALHGWYDWVGRYCYDPDSDRLAETWTAFGNYPNVAKHFPNSKPVSMSLAEVHRRIRYARDRGFRVALYFADGLLSGDQLEDLSVNPERVLFMGGWQGPDTKGKSFCQNPLSDRVQKFYFKYLSALLREYGHEIDALVWDETFYVDNGSLGTPGLRGYADRAMMHLVKKLTQTVRRYNTEHQTDIAFLTADCIGTHNFADKALYSLMADGTFHDTACAPASWSFGIFPNYRNILWSCNWFPLTRYAHTEFGVRNYQAPVAISNGYGDDTGFSEMAPELQKRIIDLFQWRKTFQTRLQGLERLIEYK